MNDGFTHAFHIAADHPFFEGHFPEFPVFPAVGQFALLAEALSILHGKKCEISTIPVAKFLNPIGPDTALSITLQPRGKNSADFTIYSAKGLVAKGKLQYRIVEP